VQQIPGLFIVPGFLSNDESDQVIQELAGHGGGGPSCGEWEVLARREVRHYNRRFYYGPNRLGMPGADHVLPFPPFAEQIAARVANRREELQRCQSGEDEEDPLWPVPAGYRLDQLTVNRYPASPPGGIAHHVDSHSAFGDIVLSISLSAHTVMEFKWHGVGHQTPSTNGEPNQKSSFSAFSSKHDGQEDDRITQTRTAAAAAAGAAREELLLLENTHSILLLPRDLLIMTGEARFAWTHSIAEKKMDVINDSTLPLRRGERISLTWRRGREQQLDVAAREQTTSNCWDAHPHLRADCICPKLCDGV
jgi:hypothetical protein